MSNLELFHRPLPFGKRPIRLQSARDVRKFLGKLINATARNDMDPDKAARLGYLAGILLKSIETSDIEGRLAELESKLARQE